LGSNFYVQTHVDNDNNKDKSVMSNRSIIMWITNTFLHNLPITYAGDDYKNDFCVDNLTSNFYVQTHFDNGYENKDNSVMSNFSIFMRITNDFLSNLPIIYASGDYKNHCFVHNWIMKVIVN
jgi:hypothetical protein